MSDETKTGAWSFCIKCDKLIEHETDSYECDLCGTKWMCHECYFKHAPANQIGCEVSKRRTNWDPSAAPVDSGPMDEYGGDSYG